MFNCSANHLILLSRMEYASCAVLVVLDLDTRRVYRLFDFTKRPRLTPGCAYCVAGKVNSVNTLYLVIESVKRDTKYERHSTTLVPTDGARRWRALTLSFPETRFEPCRADGVVASPRTSVCRRQNRRPKWRQNR
jgi:hypothetical protein